jgi:ADP-heptose:LPS heptosyltransferase
MKLLEMLRKLGRWLLLALFQLLPEGRGGAIDGPVRSVLVVRTDDRVGNLLLTTPLLAALRAGLPNARLGLLCAARRSPAVEGTGLYDDLWRFEKRDFFRHPLRFAGFCLALRRARYQVAIEAGHFHAFSFTSAALTRWSGAPVRIGHRRKPAGRFLSHAVEKDDAVRYDAAAKLELLRPLGIQASLVPLQTALGRSRVEEFRQLMGRALVLYPGARKLDHRWAAQAFAEAGRQIAVRNRLSAWIAWGPGEEVLAQQVAQQFGHESPAELLPATDLEGLAAAFRAASLVLINDTGPMHLAVAVGAPTLAVFLGDDADRWASPQANASAIRLAGIPQADGVARVIEAADELLGRQGGSAVQSFPGLDPPG